MCRRGSLQDCWLGTPARIKSKCPPYPEEHGVTDSWRSEYCAIQKEPSSILGNVCLGITSHWKGFVTVGKRQLFVVLVVADPFVLISRVQVPACFLALQRFLNSNTINNMLTQKTHYIMPGPRGVKKFCLVDVFILKQGLFELLFTSHSVILNSRLPSPQIIALLLS